MKITNAYQAQLARLGGNTDVTVQPPVNKYEKLLGDIEAGGGSGGGGSSGGDVVLDITLNDSYDTYIISGSSFANALATAMNGGRIVARLSYGEEGTNVLSFIGYRLPNEDNAITGKLSFMEVMDGNSQIYVYRIGETELETGYDESFQTMPVIWSNPIDIVA